MRSRRIHARADLARAVQGIGAAFLVPGSLAIISATFDRRPDRGRAIGTWSGFSAITSAIGPVAGGWLIEHVSWRAVFFLNVPLAAIVILLSVRFMDESRDRREAPGSTGPALRWRCSASALSSSRCSSGRGLRGSRPLVLATMAGGVIALAALVVVERRVATPMLPLGLFTSRTFTLANLLTLLLYGALATVFWLVPLNLIQVQRYSATAAGAALLPLPLLLFLLSRVGRQAWSAVPAVACRSPSDQSWPPPDLRCSREQEPAARTGRRSFRPITILGLGMTIVVAPLTTTAMSAVEPQHAGVASGVNNAIARVAGLMAIAVFGIVLTRSFDVRVRAALDRLALPPAARLSIDRELPKLAGAEIDAAVESDARGAVRRAIDDSFVSSFGLIMNVAAGVALGAAAAGALIRPESPAA